MGYVIHNIFFDAFVASKTTKNIKIPVTSTCISLWFQKLFSNSKYYFRSFCCFLPEWLSLDVFWISIHFLHYVLAVLRGFFILSHILKSIKCTHPNLIIRENILNIYLLNCCSIKQTNSMLRGHKNVTQTLCQMCWRMSSDVSSP